MNASIAVRSLRTASTRLDQVTRQFQAHQRRMAHNGTTFQLNTGARIPALGFGTWQDAEAQEPAVTAALQAGYRHIDTARVYGTEPAVGAAIKKSGIPRSDLFITTKLWNNAHHPDDVAAALDASLCDLDTPYVDLYLMHWPCAFVRGPSLFPQDPVTGAPLCGTTDYLSTYRAMQSCVKTGKARAIGISNFSLAELERLLAAPDIDIVPAVHQYECHPYLQQTHFAAWHRQHGIHVTQYSPLGNQNAIYDSGHHMPKLIDDPVLRDIAATYHNHKTAAQVALAWGVACGRSVIPKSKTPSRIVQNLEADFELRGKDVERIAGLDRKERFMDPSERLGWDCFGDLEGKKRR